MADPLDDIVGTAPSKPEPVASPAAAPAAVSDPLSDISIKTPPAVASAATSRPYLEHASDIPTDIMDLAGQGISATAQAPFKMIGTAENEYEKLIEPMKKLGASDEQAKILARRMQRWEGIADLVGGPLQTLLSPIFGPIRSMLTRPVEEQTGVPKEVTETALGLLAGRPRVGKATVKAPITDALWDSADQRYTAARALPVTLKNDFTSNVSLQIKDALEERGWFGDTTAKGTFTALGRLEDPRYNTVARIESVRKELGKLSRETNPLTGERTESAGAAAHASGLLDDWLAEIKEKDVAAGVEHLPGVLRELKSARGDYAAALRSDILEQAMDRAERQAARSGKGANIENSIRQQFDRILNNPKKARLYNEHELDMIRNVVMGGKAQNIERYAGMFSPTGIVSTAGDVAVSHLLGGKLASTVTLGGAGYLARRMAIARARENAARVAEETRKRSPLFQEEAASPAEQFRFTGAPFLATLPSIQNRAGFKKGGRVTKAFTYQEGGGVPDEIEATPRRPKPVPMPTLDPSRIPPRPKYIQTQEGGRVPTAPIVPIERTPEEILKENRLRNLMLNFSSTKPVRTFKKGGSVKQAKAAVAYRGSPLGGEQCSGCSMFRPPRECSAVRGAISPRGWCRLWEAK